MADEKPVAMFRNQEDATGAIGILKLPDKAAVIVKVELPESVPCPWSEQVSARRLLANRFHLDLVGQIGLLTQPFGGHEIGHWEMPWLTSDPWECDRLSIKRDWDKVGDSLCDSIQAVFKKLKHTDEADDEQAPGRFTRQASQNRNSG
jgi:hypothetical protein